jgi:hypothetical protein
MIFSKMQPYGFTFLQGIQVPWQKIEKQTDPYGSNGEELDSDILQEV